MDRRIATRVQLTPARAPDGLHGDMGLRISRQCATCRNLIIGVTCKAFPEGIPAAIWKEGTDHSKPYPGDNGIVYDPI